MKSVESQQRGSTLPDMVSKNEDIRILEIDFRIRDMAISEALLTKP